MFSCIVTAVCRPPGRAHSTPSAKAGYWAAGARNVNRRASATRLSHCIRLVAGAALLAGCADQGPPIPPTADFTVACDGLTCQLTDRSTDADGTIAAYAWDFGDGSGSTEPDPVHTYAAPGGEFTVTLTVTDDDGEAATAAKPVTVEPGNTAPVAEFTISCTNLTCSFTDQSTDPDEGGSIASRAWDFGDGQTSSEQNPSHTYAYPGGQFTVTLTVTDDDGASATAVKQIDVAWGSPPDRSGTYERETPHSTAGRHSRFVLRPDSTFELQDWTGADTTVHTGRWQPLTWLGIGPIEPGSVILLDFDGFEPGFWMCPDGVGSFLLDGHLGLAYCGHMIEAGFEEGVYTTAPIPSTPGPPPPQAGQIAFAASPRLEGDTGNGARIYRVNTDGSGLIRLSDGPIDDSPMWFPDGSRIAFMRTTDGGRSWSLFMMDADGSNVHLVRELPPLLGYPTLSPDGTRVAFICQPAGGDDICVMRLDEAGASPVNITGQHGVLDDPAWSPDGMLIAFSSDALAYDIQWDIWVAAPDGSQLTPLRTHGPGLHNPDGQYSPAWSADSRRIAYVECPWAWHLCSSSVIGVMNADGSNPTRLLATSGPARLTFSPDGQVIAFTSSNGIEWVSADGTQRGRIIENGHSPAWRPRP